MEKECYKRDTQKVVDGNRKKKEHWERDEKERKRKTVRQREREREREREGCGAMCPFDKYFCILEAPDRVIRKRLPTILLLRVSYQKRDPMF